jgi:hypothetical protein
VDWEENGRRDDGGIRQDMGEVFSTKVSHLGWYDMWARQANSRTVWTGGETASRRVECGRSGVYPLQVCTKRAQRKCHCHLCIA